MITTFENRCVLKKYLIVLRPIFDTTYKGKKQVKIYMWALHHKLVIFQQSRNCFCCVPENEIEGGILGCTTSPIIQGKTTRKRPQHSAQVTWVPIPSPVLKQHQIDSGSEDLFFVKERPYLLMNYRVYQFHSLNWCRGRGKIENISELKQYINRFCVRDIVITYIHADNEFEKVR